MKHMFECGKMVQTEDKRRLTKQDIYMIMILAVFAFALWAGFSAFSQKGSYAVVFYDGENLLQISLSATEEKYYQITGMNTESVQIQEMTAKQWAALANSSKEKQSVDEYNVLRCLDGGIEMLQSNCPDQICVHHKTVSQTGESIICLPHKLVIQISGTKEAELDGVVY